MSCTVPGPSNVSNPTGQSVRQNSLKRRPVDVEKIVPLQLKAAMPVTPDVTAEDVADAVVSRLRDGVVEMDTTLLVEELLYSPNDQRMRE